VSALRRFVKGPIEPRITPVHRSGLERFDRWASDFPPEFVAAITARLGRDAPGAWIVLPDERLAAFRKEPDAALVAVRSVIDTLAAGSPAPGRIVWCLDNRDEFGLSTVDAAAVFGSRLALESVHEVRSSARRVKILIEGRLREEQVHVVIRLDDAHSWAVWFTLEWLQRPVPPPPPTTLMLDHHTAGVLIDRHDSAVGCSLRGLLETGAARLGLYVPAARTAAALEDPAGELEPLRALTATPITFVRFEDVAAIQAPAATWRRLDDGGFSVDTSTVAAADRPEMAQRPYVRGGAFWPQPFDLFSPAGSRSADVPLEVVSVEARAGRMRTLWEWRTGASDARIRPLIDYDRVRYYDHELAPQLAYAQTYHDYHVYNWPKSPPSPRVTLLDAGSATAPLSVARVLAWCRRQQVRQGDRWRIVAADDFVRSARQEADTRLPPTDAVVRRDQIRRHTYLLETAREALRQDAVAFAGFIPETLGRVLELGSGYGRLAHTLLERATSYVCLDLDPAVVHEAACAPLMSGAVGDMHVLPFASASFDTVVANNVLEHAYNALESLLEIARVLTPSGRLLAFIPLDALNPAYELPAHYWKADESAIARALDMAGLRLVRSKPIDIYALGVRGSFPSCNGFTCAVEAIKEGTGLNVRDSR
jgi:SAM-dependent methyltransferase